MGELWAHFAQKGVFLSVCLAAVLGQGGGWTAGVEIWVRFQQGFKEELLVCAGGGCKPCRRLLLLFLATVSPPPPQRPSLRWGRLPGCNSPRSELVPSTWPQASGRKICRVGPGEGGGLPPPGWKIQKALHPLLYTSTPCRSRQNTPLGTHFGFFSCSKYLQSYRIREV